jgi:hypothetical protein
MSPPVSEGGVQYLDPTSEVLHPCLGALGMGTSQLSREYRMDTTTLRGSTESEGKHSLPERSKSPSGEKTTVDNPFVAALRSLKRADLVRNSEASRDDCESTGVRER